MLRCRAGWLGGGGVVGAAVRSSLWGGQKRKRTRGSRVIKIGCFFVSAAKQKR
jgi:hypothetical protein